MVDRNDPSEDNLRWQIRNPARVRGLLDRAAKCEGGRHAKVNASQNDQGAENDHDNKRDQGIDDSDNDDVATTLAVRPRPSPSPLVSNSRRIDAAAAVRTTRGAFGSSYV
jgi:hypothetical protein